MTPEEIQAMSKGLAEGQAVWYVLSACIGGAIAGLGTYLAEKGKNRATREDIGVITRTVKEVEAGFNEKLADLQAHHQLRMVAAERRMQTHQEAYTRWLTLLDAALSYTETAGSFDECRAWYTSNCLFLGVRSRKAFGDALFAAQVQQHSNIMGQANFDVEQTGWRTVVNAGDVLLEEVELPPLSPETRKIIVNSAPPV